MSQQYIGRVGGGSEEDEAVAVISPFKGLNQGSQRSTGKEKIQFKNVCVYIYTHRDISTYICIYANVLLI